MRIKFDEEMALYCINEKDNYPDAGLRIQLRRLLHSSYKISPENLKGIIFYNDVVSRNDHVELFDIIFGTCRNVKQKITIKAEKRFNIYPIGLLMLNVGHIFKIKRTNKTVLGSINKKYSSKMKIYDCINVYIRTLYYYNLERYLNKLDLSQVKAVVTFADVLPLQHVLALHANGRGIKTITCQHGFYPEDMSIDEIHILNTYKIASQTVLLWGDYSSGLFKRFSPDAVCLSVGNPRINAVDFSNNGNSMGIVLDIPDHYNINQYMITMVEECGRKIGKNIEIKLHPTDENKYEIDKDISNFVDFFNNPNVVIGYKTTMIFTLMAQGFCVLRYSEGEKYYDLPSEIEFHSLEELIERVRNLNIINYMKISKKYISAIGSESKLLYKGYFNRIGGNNE